MRLNKTLNKISKFQDELLEGIVESVMEEDKLRYKKAVIAAKLDDVIGVFKKVVDDLLIAASESEAKWDAKIDEVQNAREKARNFNSKIKEMFE